ncbi:hypothetical protein C6P45_002067 [Maudiozyma exigua]|uniref:Pre-mRNA-splicing factor CWC2 n=1 Tax=Maudiozyma exigua TaxID=34358 RepID=A0A9P6W067_MAUEX|nr:hypothetical protein C6P45_002067 [Kazachstania exigua]
MLRSGWKSKRARQQIKEGELPSGIPLQNGLTFNVWYNKWSQGNTNNGNERYVSPFRLEPKKDSGTTRASSISQGGKFCIYFARGCCIQGRNCEYMHHVPDEEDATMWTQNESVDCFGREKHSDYRDDMGGVGSFNKQNTTLYIGGITNALNDKELKPTQIESRIRFMFTRLGSIDKIRYVNDKNCAFVKYKRQINAEFAREAMMNQSLLLPNDKEWDQRLEGAGLLVKWANEDPNPEAQRQREQAERVEMLNIMKKLVSEEKEQKQDPQNETATEVTNHRTGKTGSSAQAKGKPEKMTQLMKQALVRMNRRGVPLSRYNNMDFFNTGNDGNLNNNSLSNNGNDSFRNMFDNQSFGQASDNQSNGDNNANFNNFSNNQTPFDFGLNNDNGGNNNNNPSLSNNISPQAILSKGSMLDADQISLNGQQMFRQNSKQSSIMNGSPSMNNINMFNAGNNNSNSNNNILSPQLSNSRNPSTPQQILLRNNAQNQANLNNAIQGISGMTPNPMSQISNQASPMDIQSPANHVQKNDFNQLVDNSNNRSSSNNSNSVGPLSGNANNAYQDRAAMIASMQQQQRAQAQAQAQAQAYQQQQQQRQQSTGHSSKQQYSQSKMTPQQLQQAQQQKAMLQNLSPELQQKISAELSNKQYELFMKSLVENCKRMNIQMTNIPEIQGRKVNLFFLYIIAQRLGGGQQVTRNQLWQQVAIKLHLPDAQQLEAIYYKFVLPYEKYMVSPDGVKEAQAKRVFLQQFLQELLKKVQHQFGNQQAQMRGSNGTNASNMTQQPSQQQQLQLQQQQLQQQQFLKNQQKQKQLQQQQMLQQQQQILQQQQQTAQRQQAPQNAKKGKSVGNSSATSSSKNVSKVNSAANVPVVPAPAPTTTKKVTKKPRKPRQKKKTKKELEQERKEKEEREKEQKRVFEAMQKQQREALEKKLKEKYETEMAKLPKVYKRSLIRNYKPINQHIESINGYDINYISSIGEKIDGNKPIYLFAPELGTINLHALSMSLQSNNLGEVNSALNSLLVASADGTLVIPLNQYPQLLNSICIHGITIIRDICKNWDHPQKLREHQMSVMHNYCDEYDTEAYLERRTIGSNKFSKKLDAIFDFYTKGNNKNSDSVVVVDSLTGIDINQDETMSSPASSIHEDSSDMKFSKDIDSYLTEWQKKQVHSKKWKYLPDRQCFSHISHLQDVELYFPSYLESLKKIKREVDDPFTKVNTRDAEDPRVLIIDQLSTISMILRNISFSDVNANIMCSSHILKRFISDLMWLLFFDNDKILFERKLLNFKKDIIITLSNISHNLKLDSELDGLLLLLLILSFGEPKKSAKECDSKEFSISYSEYSVNWGKYQSFGVDILAKVFSLVHPNRSFMQSVLLGQFNDERKSKNVEIVKCLINKHNGNNKTKLLNDVVSFLVSVIPFQQVTVQPTIIDEYSPIILQSLTSFFEIVKLIDTGKPAKKPENELMDRSRKIEFNELPIKWLTTYENLGVSLRRLYGFFQNLTFQKKDAPVIYKIISCKTIKLLTLLLGKCAVDKSACEELVKIPNLLPSETEFFTVLSNPIVDTNFAAEIQTFYDIRQGIFDKL